MKRAAAALLALGAILPVLPAQAGAGRLYLSNPPANTVLVYAAPNGRTQIGQITAGLASPGALTTDRQGTLYVANGNNTVTAYAPGASTPIRTYTAGIALPGPLATGPDRSLYVANAGNNTIEQFPAGSTTPARTITLPSPPAGIAVDRDGVLFVNAGTGDILRFLPGKTHGSGLGFSGLGASGLAIGDSTSFILDSYQNGLAVIARRPPLNVLHTYVFSSGALYASPTGGHDLYVFDGDVQEMHRLLYDFSIVANLIPGLPPSIGGVAVSLP